MMNGSWNMNDQIVYIPIKMIYLSPYQPRRIFDGDKIMSLARSIKRYGVIQPICVRFVGSERYELAAGERRLKAAKIAGVEVIPSIVMNIRDREAAALTLLENMQREDLDIFEEAAGIERLNGIFDCSVEEIASILGVDEAFVKDRLSLSALNEDIKEELRGQENMEELARLLLRLKEERLQRRAVDEIKKLSPGLNTAYRLINRLIEDPVGEITRQNLRPKISMCFKDSRLFINTIKKAAELMKEAGNNVKYETFTEENKSIIKITIEAANEANNEYKAKLKA